MLTINLLGVAVSFLVISPLALGANKPIISTSSKVASPTNNSVTFTCESSSSITDQTDVSFLYGEKKQVLYNKTYSGECGSVEIEFETFKPHIGQHQT